MDHINVQNTSSKTSLVQCFLEMFVCASIQLGVICQIVRCYQHKHRSSLMWLTSLLPSWDYFHAIKSYKTQHWHWSRGHINKVYLTTHCRKVSPVSNQVHRKVLPNKSTRNDCWLEMRRSVQSQRVYSKVYPSLYRHQPCFSSRPFSLMCCSAKLWHLCAFTLHRMGENHL